MRHSRADSATIKSCASHHGVSERAVRDWRNKDDPRWRAWLARSARVTAEQLDAFAAIDGEASTPATEAEAARRRFVLISRMIDEATARHEISGLPVLLRSAQESQRLLQGCRAAEAEWLLQQKRAIPISEVQAIKEQFIVPLFETVKRIPIEVAAEANPGDPSRATGALTDWLENRFRPAFEAARAEIQKAATPIPQTE